MKKEKTPKDIMIKAIMKHAGLSDFDYEYVEEEVDAILNSLDKNNMKITKDIRNNRFHKFPLK